MKERGEEKGNRLYNFAVCHDNKSLSLINGNSSVKIRRI